MEMITVEKFLNTSKAGLQSITNEELGYNGLHKSVDRITMLFHIHGIYRKPKTSDCIRQIIKSCIQRLLTTELSDGPALEYVYTACDLSKLSGFSEGTIFDFSCNGILPPPKRGVRFAKDTRGFYTEDAVNLLKHYIHLRSFSRGKDWTLARMLERRTELCL